jgi:hypothetical protein
MVGKRVCSNECRKISDMVPEEGAPMASPSACKMTLLLCVK